MHLSERIKNIEEPQTLAMAKMARSLKSKGIDVISLAIGEPDFDTPEHIREAAKKAIDEGYTHYTPVAGYQDLRETIAAKFKRDNQLHFNTDQIVISTGAKQSLFNVCQVLLNKCDEVIMPSPYWVSYSEIVKLSEGIPVVVKTSINHQFKITPQQLKDAITPKTKMFMFSSPCNPTGMIYTKEELKLLAEVFEQHHNIYIVSDEIYEHINFNSHHESIAQFDSIKERVIVVNGVSKGFAMTGWRLGYLGAAKWIAEACEKVQGQVTSGTSSITQMATIAAISSDMKKSYQMRDTFQKRRDLLVKLLKNIPGITTYLPMGAFYLFPDVSSYYGKSYKGSVVNNSTDFCMYLLNEAHVALVPGNAFGDDNCVRFSYSISEEQITEALRRIKESLYKLN